MQGLLLTELFEMYHRTNIQDDAGKGIEELVSAARSAGLCYELQSSFDQDMSFDPDTEWRNWGNNEERKRYDPIYAQLIPERCSRSIS